MDDGVEAVGALALVCIAGHQQDRQIRKVARRGERERNAVHERHADVGEQEVEATLLARQQIERLAAVASGFDLAAFARESARTKRAQGVFVFGYENARHGRTRSQRVPASTSRRLTKRTSTSWASVGGEASRLRNGMTSPGESTVRAGAAVQE